MSKTQHTDVLVFVKGSEKSALDDIDRDGDDYKAGWAAAVADEERDINKTLDWLSGYDEAGGAER